MPRSGAVPAVVVLLVLLAGCASFVAGTDLTSRLSAEGYRDPSFQTSTSTGSGDVLTITAAGRDGTPDAQAVTRAAQLAWTTFPRHLDAVTVRVGGASATFDRERLAAVAGPRDPGLDARTLAADARDTLVPLGVGLVVGLLAVVAATVVLVVVLRRSARRRPPPPPPPPTWPRYP